MKIEGSVALVTGSNRGIGAAIVEALLQAGVKRVYAAARTPSPATSPNVIPVALDITNAADIAAAAKTCGDVQILVNNAGIASGQRALKTDDADAAEREMRVNYFGLLKMSRAFAPVLTANGGGAIVNLLSILGRVSMPQAGSYFASKAAAFSLTQSLRAELPGTLVIGVMPGFVDTDMVANVQAPKLAPAEVGAAVVKALREGTEDVYPGSAAEIAAGLRHDPKAVEKQFAQMLAGR